MEDHGNHLDLASLSKELGRDIHDMEHGPIRGRTLGPQNRGPLTAALATIMHFEMLTGRLYHLRRRGHARALLARAEDIVGQHGLYLLAKSKEGQKQKSQNFMRRYRQLWRSNISLFMMTALIFVAAALVGWQLILEEPQYATLIVGEGQMEVILEKNVWFEKIREAPLLAGTQIAVNNIRVSIYAFLGGALLGFGGLALLAYNGLILGAVFAFCRMHDFDEPLRQFVLGHGPLELTIIVATTFAGLLFGRCFYARPLSQLPTRMRVGAREAGIVLLGCLPWLVLAAIIEAFVSPFDYLSDGARLAVGLLAGATFWVWTFYPDASSEG